MSTYPYVNGDGLAVLDSTTPIAAADPVSDLSPAIQQLKLFLKDPAFGYLFNSIGKTAQFKAYSSGPQTVATSNAPVQLTLFNNLAFDVDGVFNTITCVFTAQITGIYDFNACCQFDNAGSNAAAMQIILRLCKNGNGADGVTGGSFNNVAAPPDNRWFVLAAAKVLLAAGDTISVYCSNSDGVLTGSLTASNAFLFGNLVKAS